jgi:hypothetical protein
MPGEVAGLLQRGCYAEYARHDEAGSCAGHTNVLST